MAHFLIRRPLALCAVVSSSACVIGFYNRNLLFIIASVLIALLFFMAYKRLDKRVMFSLLLSLAIIFSLFMQLGEIGRNDYYSGNVCCGEFIVIQEPSLVDDYYVTVLEVEQSDILKRGTRINTLYFSGDISLSQHITADISLESINDSDYRLIEYSQKVYLKGYAENIKATDKTDFVLKGVSRLRGYIKNKVFDNMSFPEASTVLALITGDRSYFSDEFYSNLKCAGVTHIMVVSGMHLSVIVSFLLYLVEKIVYNRYLKALAIFSSVLIVLFVCGFTMSVMRAGITYILVCLSLIIDRPNTPSNTLGAAVSLILLNSPLAIFNVAFELSVLSTFGILVVAVPTIGYIKERGIIKSALLRSAVDAVIISLSAAVMTLPVVIYCFGYVSNLLIISNLLVCFPSTVALVLAVIGLITPFFNKAIFLAAELTVKYINWVINYFGGLSFAVTYLPQHAAILAVLLIIVILLALVACKKRIDMLKLNEIHEKKLREGGKKKNGGKKRTVRK